MSNEFAIAGAAARKLLADPSWTVPAKRRCGRFGQLASPGTTGPVRDGDNV